MQTYYTENNRLIYTILFLFVSTIYLNAQNGTQNLGGAMTNGVAQAGVTFENISAMYTNQAGTAFLEGWAVDVSAERRFGLEELTTFSFAAATSLNIGTVGISVGQYGFDAYTEQKVGLSYARLLTSKVAIGGQVDMLGFKLDQFGNTYAFTAELGIYTKLSRQVHLAAHVYNPTSTKLNNNEELDTRMKIGLKYIPSNKLNIYTEAEQIIDRELQLKLGVDYQVIDDLDLMAGANLNIQSFHFGFKYRLQDQFIIAAAFSFNNNQLGNSPSMSAQYWNSPEID